MSGDSSEESAPQLGNEESTDEQVDSGKQVDFGKYDTPVRDEESPNSEPDVFLDVPVVKVDEINLEVEDLRARVSLQAEVLDLVKLNVGADVALGRVSLGIHGVEAQALLKVRLDNVSAILGRVLTTIDRNPEIIEHITRGVESAVKDVGGGAGQAVSELGQGAGSAVEDVGQGAGSAVEDVGGTAKRVGRGADEGGSDRGETAQPRAKKSSTAKRAEPRGRRAGQTPQRTPSRQQPKRKRSPRERPS